LLGAGVGQRIEARALSAAENKAFHELSSNLNCAMV
jgi:hypothetical protein